MSRSSDQITTAQAAVIIINYMLGAGILTLPRTAVTASNSPDVWISVLLSSLLILLAGFVIVKLCRRFPGQTWFQFVPQITGKAIAFLISLITIGYLLTISAFELRVMAEVTGMFLLEGTPMWAIVMTFMWVGLYLTTGGIGSIARLFEIILPITLVISIITFSLSSGLFEINNLRPVLGSGVMPVLQGMKSTTLAFAGFEIMLIIMAFMSTPQKGMKAVTRGTIVPTFVYLVALVMTIGGLSLGGVKVATWPSLDLIRSFEIQGLIFERFESLLLVIWIMQIFSTFTITHYAASLGWSQLFKKNIRPFLFMMLPVIFLIAVIPKNISELFKLGQLVGNVSVYLFGTLPFFLLIISKIRRKGETSN